MTLDDDRAEYVWEQKRSTECISTRQAASDACDSAGEDDAAIGDTGRPACSGRAVRHAVSESFPLSWKLNMQHVSDGRAQKSTNYLSDRLLARQRAALRHSNGGPSGMQDMGRPACNAGESNLREPLDERQAQYPIDQRRTSSSVDEHTVGLVVCSTSSSVAASERRAVRHARNGPSGMQAEANAEIRCASSIFYRLARRAQHLTS